VNTEVRRAVAVFHQGEVFGHGYLIVRLRVAELPFNRQPGHSKPFI
jgi:hypothetical protein